MRRSLHFLLFAVRDWAGRPSHRNASSLPPSRTCLSCGSELTVRGFFHCDLICGGEFICSCLSPLSVHVCFLAASRPFALFIFLCLVPAPFQTQRPFSNVVPLSPLSPSLLLNLCWRLCCAHLLFRSSLDTCSVNVRLCVCVWDNVHVKIRGGEGNKSTILYVDSGILFFYAKETGRLENRDNICMIKWNLKPCLKEYFTQRV